MGSTLTEKKFLVYTLSAVAILVLIHSFYPQISRYYNTNNYLGIHSILEFLSIAISLSIFSFGWRRFEYTKSGKMLMVAFVFLIVGIIDLFHIITFEGMPFFITESSVAKATWLWVIARFIESFSMVLILALPDRKLNFKQRTGFFIISMCIVGFILFIVYYFEKSLPLLVIEGVGTTLLKNGIEYTICFFHTISIMMSLVFYNEKKKQDFLNLGLAFTILFLSELIFTIYRSVYDIDNLTGHVYKVVGYFFILKGYYLGIEKETFSQNYFQNKCFQTCELLREHQGIIFTIKKEGDLFVHHTCDGELLYELGLAPDMILGKSFHDVSPQRAAFVEGHYLYCWESGKNISFRILIKERTLFVTLKPMFKDDMVAEIIGSVIDLGKIEESETKLNYYATH